MAQSKCAVNVGSGLHAVFLSSAFCSSHVRTVICPFVNDRSPAADASSPVKPCALVLSNSDENSSCCKVPKGLTICAREVDCEIDSSDDTKIALAMEAMQPAFEKFGVTGQDVEASMTGGGGVHLGIDMRTVFERLVQKCDDMKQDLQGQIDLQAKRVGYIIREHSLSVVSSTLSDATDRILLRPFGITDEEKSAYFYQLESDQATRAEASKLLAGSGVNISLEELLRYRREICKPRNKVQHDLADREEFEQSLSELTLNPADHALLTQLHDREWEARLAK
jgi:hypothetical protein